MTSTSSPIATKRHTSAAKFVGIGFVLIAAGAALGVAQANYNEKKGRTYYSGKSKVMSLLSKISGLRA